MNNDHRMACAGLKDQSMSSWVIASQDVGTQHHQSHSLALALQAQTMAMTEAIMQALMMQGQKVQEKGKAGACFRCGKKGTLNRIALRGGPEWRQ